MDGSSEQFINYMYALVDWLINWLIAKDCIEDNLLNNFLKHDALTVAAKIFLFFQMTTVFPLIMYLLRFVADQSGL